MNKHNQDSDQLELWQRIGAFMMILGSLFLMGFYVANFWMDTGFFTDEFGTFDTILLFVPLILSIVGYSIQFFVGRKQPSRPFEAVSNLLMGIAAIWFLIVFPFDYSHLADVLPGSLQFLLSWVTDDIAKIVFVIVAIAGFITAFTTMRDYLIGMSNTNESDYPMTRQPM